MTRRFVDTTVLAYAFGRPSPAREGCRQVLARAGAGGDELHASTEMIQELLHHRMRRTTREEAVLDAREAMRLCVLHPFDTAVLERALELVGSGSIRGRDAVHAATALGAGFTEILSADADFDVVPGLRRIDPSDL